MFHGLETPGVSSVFNPTEVAFWALVVLMILLAGGAMFFVISFGYIMTTVCVLVGPVLLPFFIFPKMEWVAWGWIRSIFMFAMYGVVGNAYIFVWGHFLINFVDQAGADYPSYKIAALFFPLVSFLSSFIFGLFMIPKVAAGIISGHGGQSAVPSL